MTVIDEEYGTGQLILQVWIPQKWQVSIYLEIFSTLSWYGMSVMSKFLFYNSYYQDYSVN